MKNINSDDWGNSLAASQMVWLCLVYLGSVTSALSCIRIFLARK